MQSLPTRLVAYKDGYSNFDHVIPSGLEKRLQRGNIWCEHCAWDHWGAIWYARGQFHEMVKQYTKHVGTMSADTLEEVIEAVNAEYGAG